MQWRVSLIDRAFNLAADVMKLTPLIAKLGDEQAHMSKQLFRSATSIGANLEEGQAAVSRKDMALKHAIALREARETVYWLRLLLELNVMPASLEPLRREGLEMVAMLTASVKKLRTDPAGSQK
jgi:four helix bundle protein